MNIFVWESLAGDEIILYDLYVSYDGTKEGTVCCERFGIRSVTETDGQKRFCYGKSV